MPVETPDTDAQSDFHAHFADALAAVQGVLAGGRAELVCALAQDCGRHWFNLLLDTRREGLQVRLLVPDTSTNRQSSIAWERLTALGGTLHWFAPQTVQLQTSVCIVDGHVVLSGAFADVSTTLREDFAGVVIHDSSLLASQCLRGLAELGGPAQALEETPNEYAGDTALISIESLQARTAAWQHQLLQSQTLALQAELDEMQRTMQAFEHQQDAAIGELLREFLDLKRQYLAQLQERFGDEKHAEQARQAQETFQRYTEAHADDEEQSPYPELDPAQQQAMKALYRKLAMQCHPDRVEASDKSQAQALFQRLQRSYRASDLLGLQSLQAQLDASESPLGNQEGTQGLDATQKPVADWTLQLAALNNALAQQHAQRQTLLRSATWRTLATQSRWDLWFAQQAKHLQTEVQRYREALAQVEPDGAARIA